MNLSTTGHVLEPKRLVLRDLTKEDMKLLEQPRVTPTVQKIRDSHHRVARLLALDMTQTEVAKRTGYSTTRVHYLLQDPAFLDLVSKYRAQIDEKITQVEEEYVELLVGNRMKAERQLSDKLDDADANDEFLPTRDLIAISRDAADRTGFGKHSTKTVNVDWASQLERSINRSKRAAGVKIIEGQVVYPSPPLAADTPSPQGGAQDQTSDAILSPAPLITRR